MPDSEVSDTPRALPPEAHGPIPRAPARRALARSEDMQSPDPPLRRDALLRTIATSRLFRALDPAFQASLVPHASITHLEQGGQLWCRGALADHFLVILRGVLELQRAATGSVPTLVALFGPGESPGIVASLEQRTFVADAFAATPVLEVLRVRARPVLDALGTEPKLASAMNRALLDHSRLLYSKIDVLTAGSVHRRLAAFFLDLAARFGDEQEDGTHYVPLALSRQQIATYVGARVETVIRACSGWQKQGVLETTREGFVLSNYEALREMVESTVIGEQDA